MIAEGFPFLFFVKNAQFSGKSVFCAAKTRKMCVKSGEGCAEYQDGIEECAGGGV